MYQILAGDMTQFKSYKEAHEKFLAVSKIAIEMGDRISMTCGHILAQPSIYSSVQGRLLGKMTEF